jgi:hypothetical protein
MHDTIPSSHHVHIWRRNTSHFTSLIESTIRPQIITTSSSIPRFTAVVPKSGKLCTTFATELVLRRVHASGVSVRIKPGANWNAQDKARIEAFQPDAKSTDHFGEMVLQAKYF